MGNSARYSGNRDPEGGHRVPLGSAPPPPPHYPGYPPTSTHYRVHHHRHHHTVTTPRTLLRVSKTDKTVPNGCLDFVVSAYNRQPGTCLPGLLLCNTRLWLFPAVVIPGFVINGVIPCFVIKGVIPCFVKTVISVTRSSKPPVKPVILTKLIKTRILG